MEKFIYVFTIKDKEKLMNMGFSLLKEDKSNNIFVFENRKDRVFSKNEVVHICSDKLTFGM